MNDLAGSRKLPLALLAACCLLPAFQTFVAVTLEFFPAVTYPVMKGLMIVGPVLVWRWARLGRAGTLGRIGMRKAWPVAGVAVGVVMAGLIFAFYYGVLRSRVGGYGPMLADKLDSLGIREHYWTMVVVISFANSALEEYYWRGFILGELLDRLDSRAMACVVAGGLFGLHHIFAVLFLGNVWLIAAGVLMTVVAGVVWNWMRAHGASLLDCYVSHIMADLAALWVGWDMMSGV